MKKLFKTVAVCGLFVGLLSITYACTDDSAFSEGKRQLENMGYTEVQNTGYDWFCCGKGDDFSTGFSAKDKNGNVATGCFCSGFMKGTTIRFK